MMVMQQQNPGWSSTPMAGGANNVDTFSRIMAMRYGGRTDDIWSYLDQPGYRTSIGGASSAPAGGWSYNLGSGAVAIQGMGGGGTPSNPGGYNWGTLGNVVKGVKENIANPILDKVMPTTGKSGQPAFRTGGMYGAYRGKQQQVQKAQTYQAAQQARQQQAQQAQATASMNQTMNAYQNAWNPSMNYSSAYQQAATQASQGTPQPVGNFATTTTRASQVLAAGQQAKAKRLVRGASTPLRKGPPTQVNLLTGPAALNPPPKKPRSARSSVTKPKATRPTTDLNDPSNW